MKQLGIIIIAVLIALLILREFGCRGRGSGNPGKADTVIVWDTTWQKYDSIVVKKVPVKIIIHDTLPPEFYPDPMYDSLKVQYQELAQEFLAKKIYVDTLKVPQLKGLFIVSDTVKNNSLIGRKWSADYIIPVVKETITITKEAEPKAQVYVGGGLSVSGITLNSVQTGLLYKSRKDHMLGAYAGVDLSGKLSYGIQSYWKINLKKTK
jgi:hypothetical protein